MHPKLAILSVLAITCNGLSIERVPENHKSGTITGFENKNDSDNVKKYLAIAIKKHVKKRLASPLNYRVSTYEESDDYYEKGGGDSDNNNEGNYESKDWSDLYREPIDIKNKTAVLKNLDLTNIEGIDVIKKQSEDFQSPKNIVKNEVVHKTFDSEEDDEKQDGNPLIAIFTTEKNKVVTKKPNNSDELNDYYDIQKTDEKIVHNHEKSIEDKLKKPKDNQDISYYDEPSLRDEKPYTKVRKTATTTEKIQVKRRKIKTNYAMNDYYDTADKIRLDAEQAKEDRENEVKKIKILDAVDDLKERHAQESKLISEKFKEEELQREEFERNNARNYPRNSDKYRESSFHKPRGRVISDYEEYEERPNFRDKYKPEPVKKPVTTVKSTTTAVSSQKPPSENRKMSVFRSPHLYLSYDDADETNDQTTSTRKVAKPITVPESSNERISLIPEDAKEGEPTLFMPKKFYKYKKQKKPNNIIEEYKPQNKYKPNKNIRSSTLAMIADNYFPTTDISFTMPTKTLYSTETSTEQEDQELRSKLTEYKYTITEDLQPHRSTATYYNEKTNGDSDYTDKSIGDRDNTEKTIGDSDNTEKIIGDRDYTEQTIADSDNTEITIGDGDTTEKTVGDIEVDMSGVGSDFNSITTNENFEENSTDTYDKVDAKYPDIEPEISLARIEGTTEFSSEGTEDVARPTLIIHERDDLAPESSYHQSENSRMGKERGGGRRHDSAHDQEYKEQAKKHYESENEEEITGKGYHNVKKDIDKYDSHDQTKEAYGEDSGHSASHDHRESGKKHAEYEETGKHSKGHSTKGSHDVHKKEEYEKKEEFEFSSEEEDKAKKTRTVKSYDQRNNFRPVAVHSKPRRAYAISDAAVQAQIKKPTIRNTTREKWIHHHGYPARTNNLILIDRRRDFNTNFKPF